jgi:hypothetical protein
MTLVNARRRAGRRWVSAGIAVAVMVCRSWTTESAPDSVKITVPANVGFAVTNVGVATTGNPNPTTVSFSSLSVTGSHVLKISIKADANFVPPSGTAIPASNVSWTTTAASNGTGTNGTLSTTTYNQIFLAGNGKKSGSVDVHWTLAAPGTPLHAGTHTLTVRWKLESF